MTGRAWWAAAFWSERGGDTEKASGVPFAKRKLRGRAFAPACGLLRRKNALAAPAKRERAGKGGQRPVSTENGRPPGGHFMGVPCFWDAALSRAPRRLPGSASHGKGKAGCRQRSLISHSSGKIRSSRSHFPSRGIVIPPLPECHNSTSLCVTGPKVARKHARREKIFCPSRIFCPWDGNFAPTP